MLVANSVVKYSNDLCSLSHIIVAAVACHLRMMEFSRVPVSITERSNSLAFKEAKSEFSFEYTIRIVENSEAMHLTSFEFTLVMEF
jgi:hypothetical protein